MVTTSLIIGVASTETVITVWTRHPPGVAAARTTGVAKARTTG
jgi:hypothetical protein